MATTYYQRIAKLGDYYPSNRFRTSQQEMDMIARTLELEGMSAFEMQNLRDMVVLIYTDRSERAYNNDNREQGYNHTLAMMSVTAVIDHYMYNIEAK